MADNDLAQDSSYYSSTCTCSSLSSSPSSSPSTSTSGQSSAASPPSVNHCFPIEIAAVAQQAPPQSHRRRRHCCAQCRPRDVPMESSSANNHHHHHHHKFHTQQHSGDSLSHHSNAAAAMKLGGVGGVGGAGGCPADRIRTMYPNVNETDFPLPRSWSPQDKCNSIGLSQNNLRVHYKGVGKSHSDAASVRTANPIPPACGLYYFEVKIISKGRDGYMGIGLTSQTFRMDRLPGWDKQSFGYHGDDGNSFCSSGNGQPYGPTFTTGDIIGCGVNLVNSTCFYTKNGHHLGTAFRDLPSKLYPTVGLQTPGEVIDANFGQDAFTFDISDMVEELRAITRASIYETPLPDRQCDWTVSIHKLISTYLVHHGYTSTAESFARTTNQDFLEDVSSIKNRQKIIKLVMSGRMGQAIELTLKSYPGVLESNPNLLFMLKCRQFVEMVNGSDFEQQKSSSTSSVVHIVGAPVSPVVQTSVIQSTKAYTNGGSVDGDQVDADADCLLITDEVLLDESVPSAVDDDDDKSNKAQLKQIKNHRLMQMIIKDLVGGDVDMDNNHTTNGNTQKIESNTTLDEDEEMEIDLELPSKRSTKSGVERMLEFGRELFQLSQRLEKDQGVNEANQKMLEDAFSLLAYSNPWSSPLGWQLCPSRRETVCAALNSAILESMNYSWRPPLEVNIAHACQLLRLMACSSIGACAFASIDDVLQTGSTH